jgi:small conductance mechanosensitive channel
MEELFIKWWDIISPWVEKHGIKIALILVGSYILKRLAQGFLKKVVLLSISRDKSLSKTAQKKREDTLIRIFSWMINILIILLVILMILQEIGIPVAPLLASAGIAGLAIGFGGQYLIRDLISGFFIILENQYRIGDVINVDGTGGLVEDISLRMTTLRDLDGTVYHIPHGEIKKVANLTKLFARVNLNIGVAYDTKLEQLIELVNRVGNEIAQDPAFKDSILQPPQFVRIDNFADSAMIIKIIGETIPLKQWEITGELRKRLKLAFDKEGIEIPYPQVVVRTKSN